MNKKVSLKKNWKARLVSGLLSLAMVASLLPAGLFTLPALAYSDWTVEVTKFDADTGDYEITITQPGSLSSTGSVAVALVPEICGTNRKMNVNEMIALNAISASLSQTSSQLGGQIASGTGLPSSVYAIHGGSFSFTGNKCVIKGTLAAGGLEGVKAALKAAGGFKYASTDATSVTGGDVDAVTAFPYKVILVSSGGVTHMYEASTTLMPGEILTAKLAATNIEIHLDGEGNITSGNQSTTITNSGNTGARIQSVTLSGGLPPFLVSPGLSHHLNVAGGLDLLKSSDNGKVTVAGDGASVSAQYAAAWVDTDGMPYAYTTTATVTYIALNRSGNPIAGTQATATFEIRVIVDETGELIASAPSFTGTIGSDGTGLSYTPATGTLTLTVEPSDGAVIVTAFEATGASTGNPDGWGMPELITEGGDNLGVFASIDPDNGCWLDADGNPVLEAYDEETGKEFLGYFYPIDNDPNNGPDLSRPATPYEETIERLEYTITPPPVTSAGVYTLYLKVDYIDNATGANKSIIVPITAVVTETAAAEQYSYTFKANKPSGSGGTVSGLPSGGQTTGPVSYPTAPTLTGYTFKGWGSSAAGGSAPSTADWTSGSKTISADTDFHAIWEAYKITFNPQGGKFSDNSVNNKAFDTVDGKLSSANVNAVSAPTKAGYVFDGWYTAATGGTKLTDLSASKVFDGSKTYHAQWKAVTVTFDPNGGSLASASGTGVFNTTNGKLTSTDIGKVTGSNAPTHSNTKKAFRGWSTTTSADDIVTLNTTKVYETNTIYHAIWGDLYTITYNNGGADSGSVPAAQTQTSYGQELTVAGNSGNLAKAGHIFGGWSYNGGTYGPGKTEKLAPTADVTLTAIWLKTYSLIYNSNTPSGGTVNNMPADDDNSGVGYLPGETTTVTSDEPTCAGYTFLGWATSADATSAAYTGGESLKFDSANINLYAVWSELPAISGATATDASKFEFGGTVALKEITLTVGAPWPLPTWAPPRRSRWPSGTWATAATPPPGLPGRPSWPPAPPPASPFPPPPPGRSLKTMISGSTWRATVPT